MHVISAGHVYIDGGRVILVRAVGFGCGSAALFISTEACPAQAGLVFVVFTVIGTDPSTMLGTGKIIFVFS